MKTYFLQCKSKTHGDWQNYSAWDGIVEFHSFTAAEKVAVDFTIYNPSLNWRIRSMSGEIVHLENEPSNCTKVNCEPA